jgi:CubicO group peptidase (beta-lactamase class C family)
MHIVRHLRVWISAMCIAGSGTVIAAPVLTPPDPGIDALMRRYDGQVPGAAVLVLHDGTPVFRRGYGLAVLEDHTAVTAQTNFRLASISKQFTAAAILLLTEDGALTLDDPVKRWLPSLPAAADAITLRQLLSHTSGLLDYEALMPADATVQVHDQDVLHLLEHQDRTYFAPGTAYRYSNSGYALLALVVGKASGTDFASFLRQRIFLPLGMRDTVAHQDGVDDIARRAYGYSERDGRWQRTDQSPTSAVLGDGGVYSSLDDLARWDAALYDQRLLKATSLKQMFSPATPTTEPDVPFYGFGWRLNGGAQWHSGESIGFRNVILRYPAQRLTVIVLSNRNTPEPYPLALQIARRWLDTLQ